MRAAITVGRWRADLRRYAKVRRYKKFGRFEAVARSYTLYAYVDTDVSLHLVKSPLYQELDPSEKRSVSYFLGMTTAKLLSERLLNVAYLMHFDRYAGRYKVALGGSRKPDLIAPINATEWLVVEAKGRTNELRGSVKQDMRTQKGSIKKINGRRPALTVGAAAHFSTGYLEGFWCDPDDDPPNGSELDMSVDEHRAVYYAPLVDLLQEDSADVDETDLLPSSRLAYIPDVDVWVGLRSEVYTALIGERDLDDVPSTDEMRLPQVYKGPDARNSLSLGPDGVVVALGSIWETEARLNAFR